MRWSSSSGPPVRPERAAPVASGSESEPLEVRDAQP